MIFSHNYNLITEKKEATIENKNINREAIVIFCDSQSFLLLKLLKKNFRHCFVLVKNEQKWIVFDPLSHCVDLKIIEDCSSLELVEWYLELGMIPVPTHIRRPDRRLAPIRPFTCVEAVKRVLGIHQGWILTPWSLYTHLVASQFKKKNLDYGP